jgi:hypothetical protein
MQCAQTEFRQFIEVRLVETVLVPVDVESVQHRAEHQVLSRIAFRSLTTAQIHWH